MTTGMQYVKFGLTVIMPMQADDGDIITDGSYVMQRKYDGTRCLVFRKHDEVKMIGREWKNDYAPLFPEIVAEVKKMLPHHFILDTELTFFLPNGEDRVLTALATPEKKAGMVARLMVFDCLALLGHDVRSLTLENRLELVNRIVPQGLEHVRVVETHTDARNFPYIYREILAQRGEGVVLKKRGSPYIDGSRHYWMKVKGTSTADCVVLGITHGTNSRQSTFGSLVLGQYSEGVIRYVGKVNVADTEAREALNRIIMAMPEGTPAVSVMNQRHSVRHDEVKKWVDPTIVTEVKFQNRTANRILRFPVFLRVRDDKPAIECEVG